jgi:uncharacterized protein YjdB
VDLSSCPSIIKYQITCTGLRSLNTRNCTNLEYIQLTHISLDGLLTELDLRDNIALEHLSFKGNKISRVDLGVSVLKSISSNKNQLHLSYLYAFSEMVSDPWRKILGPQFLPLQRIAVGDSVDFSDQKEFGGIKTVFYVERDGVAAQPEDYQVKDGIITFFKSGYYLVTMSNGAIVAYQGRNEVDAPFNVVEIVPVSEIINLPTTAIVGVPLILSGTVLPAIATNKTIAWSVKDPGTTGGIINPSGIRLYTTAPGTATITATIKEGAGFNEDYTQDFCVEVLPLGIDEHTVENITVIPNPTTGELRIEIAGQAHNDVKIENVEVFDSYGRKQKVESRRQNEIDISGLSAGIYFVKIITEQGEIVKKIVKQ